MPSIRLGFDLRSGPGGASHGDLTAAVLDMCEWADRLDGIEATAAFLEHHGSPDGYMPSPMLFAAAVAGRTRRLTTSTVLLAPLYHPLRLAEDMAVLDLISKGRNTFILGAGYRQDEFDALGVPMAERGKRMEVAVDTALKAWTGEPFAFEGKSVRVMPRPFRRPRPPIVMGGSSNAAARRAARIADGFAPTSPDLMDVYRDERKALGKDAGPPPPARGGMVTVVAVSKDPDATWKAVGAFCLHEMNTYASWLKGTPGKVPSFWEVPNVNALKDAGRYLVLTPEECVARAQSMGGALAINPLTGGIAPDVGWTSLKLIESEVLPKLR